MAEFMTLLSHYPGFVPSALLGALLVFWVLAVIGLLDFDHFGPDWLDAGEGLDHGDAAPEMVVALGLDKLPFSVVLSGIVFYWWLLTMLGGALLLAWLPLPLWLSGSLLLLVSFLVALPLAALSLRPLKPLFVVHTGTTNAQVLGRVCKVLTLRVDESFGQAEVPINSGAPLNVRVYAEAGNGLSKGDTALVIEYDAQRRRYRVEPYQQKPIH